MEMTRLNLFKGQIIELKVQEEFLRYGFDVSIPTYNASRYDLIVDTGKEIFKIQTKKSIQNSQSSFTFHCWTQNNNKSNNNAKHKYTKDEIDYFATVWKDKVYLVPVDETSNQKTIQLDSDEYLAENILSSYYRMSDEELYNVSSTFLTKNKNNNNNNLKYFCIDCHQPIRKEGRCLECSHLNQRVVERPSREVLKNLIRTESFTEIGKKYEVSDNAIRKWCDSYSLPRKKSEIKKYTKEEWESL